MMIKKNIMVMMHIWVMLSYCMDQPKMIDLNVGKTVLRVSKRSILDADETVDFVVVGMRKQLSLRGRSDIFLPVGSISCPQNNTIFIKQKNRDMIYIQEKKMKSTVITITEPSYFFQDELQDRWSTWRKAKKEHVAKELAMCYERVLCKIPEIGRAGRKEGLTVAIPEFGISNVFSGEESASIVVDAILNFVQKNPFSYKMIHLLVSKRVVLYRDLITQKLNLGTWSKGNK